MCGCSLNRRVWKPKFSRSPCQRQIGLSFVQKANRRLREVTLSKCRFGSKIPFKVRLWLYKARNCICCLFERESRSTTLLKECPTGLLLDLFAHPSRDIFDQPFVNSSNCSAIAECSVAAFICSPSGRLERGQNNVQTPRSSPKTATGTSM